MLRCQRCSWLDWRSGYKCCRGGAERDESCDGFGCGAYCSESWWQRFILEGKWGLPRNASAAVDLVEENMIDRKMDPTERKRRLRTDEVDFSSSGRMVECFKSMVM